MRDAMEALGGDPKLINPLVPVELVIDHSIQVDSFAEKLAFQKNAELEFERNRERYAFLRWGQTAFDDFAVVPPNTGICHQVNLEYLATVVTARDGQAFPDTLVGTDSHTTMVNGLGVLGWGVGGIEAEAAMLGQPVSMLLPRVVGFRLEGELPEGSTATDLVLTVTEMLRERGVVGSFVEFFGPGLANLPLADRATIGNMSPEFGSTCAIFPVDAETLRYLEFTGRPAERIALVEAYTKEQGLFHDESSDDATYSDTLELDLSTVEPSLAGPKRPQDRVALSSAATRLPRRAGRPGRGQERRPRRQRRAAHLPRQRPAVLDGGPGRRGRRRARARPRRGGRGGGRQGQRQRDPRRGGARAGGRRGGDRRHHELHEHLQPLGHARRRPAGPQRRGARPDGASRGSRPRWRPGSKVVTDYLDRVGADRSAGGARLQPGRLRLHDLHRQLGPAAGRDLRGDRGRGPDRVLGAVGQPQLRGPDPPRGQDELPGLAAAVRGLRAGGPDGPGPAGGAAGGGLRRRAGVPARHLALAGGGERRDRVRGGVGHVPQELRRGVRGRRELERAGGPRGRPLRLGRRVHLREAARRTSRTCPPTRRRTSSASRAPARSRCWATA